MSEQFVPINSMRTKSGALAALVAPFGEAAAQPVPLPPGSKLNSFDIFWMATSFSLAAALKVSPIFEGSVGVNDSAFFFDCMIYHDEYNAAPKPTDLVLATRWGVGLRIALKVTNLQAKTSINFSVVSASVEAGLASATYHVQGPGLGVDGMKIVTDKVGTLGDFKFETYYKMNREVIPAVGEYLQKNVDKLTPEPIAVWLSSSIEDQPINQARAVYFATRWVAERKPLADSLKMPQSSVLDRDMIRLVYARLAGTIPETQAPSKEAEQKAESWLNEKF